MDGRRGSRKETPIRKVVGFVVPDKESSSSSALPQPTPASRPVDVPAPSQPPPPQKDGFYSAHMDHNIGSLSVGSPRAKPRMTLLTEQETLPSTSGTAGEGTTDTTSGPSTKSMITSGINMSMGEELSAPSTPGGHTSRVMAVSKEEATRSPLSSPRPPPIARGGNAPGAVAKVDWSQAREIPLKAKPTTKEERRLLQEAQRAAKAKGAGKEAGGTSGMAGAAPSKGVSAKKDGDKKGKEKEKDGDKAKEVLKVRVGLDVKKKVEKNLGKSSLEHMVSKKPFELFSHLPQYERKAVIASVQSKFASDLHPAVYQLGLSYLNRDITGATARCVAMLNAFKCLVEDYTSPSEKSLARDLTSRINTAVNFLSTCRPLATSMGNAIKYLKLRIADLGKLEAQRLSEADAKGRVIEHIQRFIQDKIVIADQEIVKHALTKIKDGDVVLTYASSNVVEQVLKAAHSTKKDFSVIVADSEPHNEGKEMVLRLARAGLRCTYILVHSVNHYIKQASCVIVGAASIHTNGSVVSRVGTAYVTDAAKEFLVPVLVCCESFKFHERIQHDSICFNELGDPHELARDDERGSLELKGWEDIENLNLLNLTYDTTPADNIDVVITELGMIPTSSVPVILREYRREAIL